MNVVEKDYTMQQLLRMYVSTEQCTLTKVSSKARENWQ